jgi:argonaute-like protein implicated in RNA metabolism and viral defense
MPKSTPNLTEAILRIVENQLRENNPPEARLTLDRLIASGYSQRDARQLIAQVIVTEVFSAISSKQPYDEGRYIAALKRLPLLPADE